MSLSFSELRLVIEELASEWVGAFMQKIYMNGPRQIIVTLRVPSRRAVLRLSVEPQQSYLCVVDDRGPTDPQASAFCMLLRKWFKGSRLHSLRLHGDDRIVEIVGSRAVLMAEMLGTRGRYVLCDRDYKIIASAPQADLRPGLAPGELWRPPPPGGGDTKASRLEKGVANESVATLYVVPAAETHQGGARTVVSKSLAARIKKHRRLLKKIESDMRNAEDQLLLERFGELLKMNLALVRRGLPALKVTDFLYSQGQVVEIPLDPRLSPTENLNRLFKKARKARRTLEVATQRFAETCARIEQLELQRDGLAECSDEVVNQLAEELGVVTCPPGVPKRKLAAQSTRVPYRTFRTDQGRKIFVGRSAGDNDKLTVQVARPDDLWLHARGYPGSHVVVPLGRGEEVDQNLLIDAATLAAHFSEARGNTTVEVTYTRRKHVQKSKAMPPGKVLLRRERVLLLAVEEERLERLLRSRYDS